MSDEHFTVDGTLMRRGPAEEFPTKDGNGKTAGPGGDVDLKGKSGRTRPMNGARIRCRLWTKSEERGEAELHGTCNDGEPQRTLLRDLLTRRTEERSEMRRC